MNLRAYTLTILISIMMMSSILCFVQYDTFRMMLHKKPKNIFAEKFSTTYSKYKVGSTFISIFLSNLSLFILVFYFKQISYIFKTDLSLIISCFSFYYVCAVIIPHTYDQLYVENIVTYSKTRIVDIIPNLLIIYIFGSIGLSAFVLVMNRFYPDEILEINKTEMNEVELENPQQSLTHSEGDSPKPVTSILFSVLIFALVKSLLYGYDIFALDSEMKVDLDILPSLSPVYIFHQKIFTNHTKYSLRGLFNSKIAISDNIFKLMNRDDIQSLASIAFAMKSASVPTINLVINITKALFFALIFKNVYDIGLSSFGGIQTKQIGAILIISFALFSPLLMFLNPIENLINKEVLLQSDCIANESVRNLERALTVYMKQNGQATSYTQIYKALFLSAPTLSERLRNLKQCKISNR